jgi:hypothetical protein
VNLRSLKRQVIVDIVQRNGMKFLLI